jgi:hypothetical protein
MGMRFRWVNHAAFVLETGPVQLLSDPWLFGSAFADSWDLLAPTRLETLDFGAITHIWVSHEHPDHFSPPSLRSIPEEDRQHIVLMTQRTRDRRVAAYCETLGFGDVVELPSGTWLDLAPDVEIMCQPVKLDDSWLAVRAGDRTVLNLNDCLIATEDEVDATLAKIGHPVDILLTQFSFAAWIGNPDDTAAHVESARIARDRFITQTRTIAPKWVIPFASYVWFSHEENAYMNTSVNHITDIVAEVRRSLPATTPIVLYPGDTWTPGRSEDPTPAALEAYAADEASVPGRTTHPTQPRTLEELQVLAEGHSQELLGFHGSLLKLLPSTPVWLVDHKKAVMLSVGALTAAALQYEQCDIALTSDAFGGMLQNMWGGMALLISGRFRVPSGGDVNVGGPPRRFYRYVRFADDVNHGWPLRKELLFRLRSWLPWRKDEWLDRHNPDDDRTVAADASAPGSGPA